MPQLCEVKGVYGGGGRVRAAQAEPTEGGHSAHLVIVCLFAPGQRRQKGVAGPAL